MKKKAKKSAKPMVVSPCIPLAGYVSECGNGAVLCKIVGGYVIRNLTDGGERIDCDIELKKEDITAFNQIIVKGECLSRLTQDLESRQAELFLDVLDERHSPESIEIEFTDLQKKFDMLDKKKETLNKTWKKLFNVFCKKLDKEFKKK